MPTSRDKSRCAYSVRMTRSRISWRNGEVLAYASKLLSALKGKAEAAEGAETDDTGDDARMGSFGTDVFGVELEVGLF